MLLSNEINILFYVPFLTKSKFSRVRCRFCVAWHIHSVVFLPIFLYDCFCFVDARVAVLFLVSVISLLPRFFHFLESLYQCIKAISTEGTFSSSFFFWHIVRQRHLHLHIYSCSLVNFLSPSLLYVKNCPEYLTRGTTQVFIHSMRFLLYSLVSRIFLVFLRNSFLIFSFTSACLMVCTSNIPKYL